MVEAMDAFKATLKNKGLKATPQRIAVHEAMLELCHASADQVAELIRNRSGVNITFSSVYNILSQMSELGIYAQRMSSNSKMYFDVKAQPHVHLYDRYNQKFIDIDDRGLVDIVMAALKKRKFKGYKMDGVDVQIICRPSRMTKTKD